MSSDAAIEQAARGVVDGLASALGFQSDTLQLVRVHHLDLARLSFDDGDMVTVTTSVGSFDGIVIADDAVVAGTMLVPFGTRTVFGAAVQRYLDEPTLLTSQVRMTSR